MKYLITQLLSYFHGEAMKISGFSICRNAVKFDYPIIEVIRSALPIVDEFVVKAGQRGSVVDENLLDWAREFLADSWEKEIRGHRDWKILVY